MPGSLLRCLQETIKHRNIKNNNLFPFFITIYNIRIDVRGLNIIQNSPHNFLLPGNNSLNLQNRINGGGITIFKIKF